MFSTSSIIIKEEVILPDLIIDEPTTCSSTNDSLSDAEDKCEKLTPQHSKEDPSHIISELHNVKEDQSDTLKCKFCDKMCLKQSELQIHVRIHTGEKPYVCDYCKKRFSQSSSLNRHVRSHTGEKPFKCEFCKKLFVANADLKKHVRIHTGEKPFVCQFCNKGFTLNSTLVKHERLHTGDKPYICKFCWKTFSATNILKTHLKIHTREKSFKCEQCDCSFSSNYSLLKHVRVHIGEKPFSLDLKVVADTSLLKNIKTEQHYAIQYYVRRGFSAPVTVQHMRNTYKDECLSERTIFRWHKAFVKGRESAAQIPHGGRPSKTFTDVNINAVAAIIHDDSHLSIRALESLVHISKTSIHRILTKHLHKQQVCWTWVPKLLTREQMNDRVQFCTQLLDMCDKNLNFFNEVITCNESWIHYNKSLTEDKDATGQVPSIQPPGKVLLIVFFDCFGLICHHFVLPNTMIDNEYYSSVIQTLREHISRTITELKKWVLHHDEERPHISNITKEFLDSKDITILSQPAYSPDLAPSDFWFFPMLKKELRGRQFATDSEVQSAIESFFKNQPQEEFKRTMLSKWQERLRLCVKSGGQYFEKELKSHVSEMDRE